MRGIIVGGMVLGLLMGCNNGLAEELAAEKRLGEIGRSAEKIFHSFIELVSDVFNVNENTTRDDVKNYFTGLANGVEQTIQALVEIGNKMQQPSGDEQKSVSVESSNQEIQSAKDTLTTLKGHIEALKDIGDTDPVGNANTSGGGGQAVENLSLKKATDALKGIVQLAKDSKAIKDLKTSDAAVSTVAGGGNPQDGIKILGTDFLTANDEGIALVFPSTAPDIVSSSSFELIIADNISCPPTLDSIAVAIAFAKGTTVGNLAKGTEKISAVAGGIALRSLVKSEKLGATSNLDAVSQGAGTMAANKLIGTVEDLIKKTVKKVLEKAKGEIDKARASKTTV